MVLWRHMLVILSTICSGNALPPVRCQIDHMEQTTVTLDLKYKTFVSENALKMSSAKCK